MYKRMHDGKPAIFETIHSKMFVCKCILLHGLYWTK